MIDPPDVLAAAFDAVFDAEVDLSAVACIAVIDATLRATVQARLVEHFVDIARHGYQFERFEEAWCAWADAEAAMDWTQERLQDTVVELLAAGATSSPDHEALCGCAAKVLAAFGSEFREWLETNIAAGALPSDFTDFAPATPTLCPGIGFEPGTAEALGALLEQRYATYTEVSYRLHHPASPPRRPSQHLPASNPSRLRRRVRLQPRPARTDRTWEQLTWTSPKPPIPCSRPTRCSPTRT